MNQSNETRTSLLMTGSELMSGDIIDSNSAYIAQVLLDIGLNIDEKLTLGDEFDLLLAHITRLTQTSDLLIINGGLGPTTDDLTAEVLAKAASEELIPHHEAEKHVIDWCTTKGFQANSANLKQALLPASSHIFPDAPGSAPAFYLTINNCLVIATPGVPSELKVITKQNIVGLLQTSLDIKPCHPWQKFYLMGIGESRLQQVISDEFSGIENTLAVGFRADFPTLELKLRPLEHLSADDKAATNSIEKLLLRLEDFLITTHSSQFAERLIKALKENNNTFSSAESCTGGLIASKMTKVPGASSVFSGSIVSYSNQMKQELLNVPESTIDTHGAVSQQTAKAMLLGALSSMKSDLSVAVTGIAGPSGGTKDKPIGSVWIAWGTHENYSSIFLSIPLGREMFQELVAIICLDLIYRHTKGNFEAPKYLSRWEL